MSMDALVWWDTAGTVFGELPPPSADPPPS